jgi:hypothetical protein
VRTVLAGMIGNAVEWYDYGRVVHRLALDHADRVTRAAVLDIVPTSHFYQHVTQESATAYYHWFFLLQPSAEKIIENSLELFVGRGNSPASKEYLRCRNQEDLRAVADRRVP